MNPINLRGKELTEDCDFDCIRILYTNTKKDNCGHLHVYVCKNADIKISENNLKPKLVFFTD